MLKKFRGKKYGCLVTVSPSGHRYCFKREEETTPEYRGEYCLEDEVWMMELCGGKMDFLLEWANPPENVKETPFKEKPFTQEDVFGNTVFEDVKPIPAAKSQAQLEAELYLAGIDERNAKWLDLKTEVVEEGFEGEKKLLEVPKFGTEELEREFWRTHDSSDYLDWSKAASVVFPNLKKSFSKEFLAFKAHWKNASGEMASFIKEMKLEYKVPVLQALCVEVGIDAEGTKAEMLEKLATFLIEGV